MENADESARKFATQAVERAWLRAGGALIGQALCWHLPDRLLWGVGDYAGAAGAFYFTFALMQALDAQSIYRAVQRSGAHGDALSVTWSYRWQQRLGEIIFFPALFIGGFAIAGGFAWLIGRI